MAAAPSHQNAPTSAPAPPTGHTPSPASARALVLVLSALTAVAPLATDMYVPGFPALGRTLHAGSSAVQLTMTAFLAGLVIGQLVFGPISDGIGRRRLLIGGTAGFTVFSLASAIAPNIAALTATRFLQGVAGAAGMVLARAVLTDRFHGAELPRYFAALAQIMGIAPIAAPVLGGLVLSISTWRAVFVVLAALGIVLLLGVLRAVPESLPPERRHGGGIGSTFRAMGSLVRFRAFMGYVLTLGFAAAALFSYIAGSSFVFEDIHGVSASVYSLIFATNAVGMLVGGFCFSRLAHRVRLNKLLTAGVVIATIGTSAQVALRLLVGETLAWTWITLFVSIGAIGLIFPSTMSIGQGLGRRAPGAASALLGGFQFLLGALASPLVGVFGTTSSLPMAAIMLISMACACLALFGLARPWEGNGEPE
ncbi:multidrug effflux MFS transporter [Actinospica sp.]|uniref:multidrug effflux MFS transporter n=1 Tax=Actinospica sp. TaxID=1872142 RepID=UPI002CB7C7ED|nr:multidrug effflux MFS transporter [Actinospica sp.]HWG23927.1 multidrug effflux MFS transporter [Actinospica sp.]